MQTVRFPVLVDTDWILPNLKNITSLITKKCLATLAQLGVKLIIFPCLLTTCIFFFFCELQAPAYLIFFYPTIVLLQICTCPS